MTETVLHLYFFQATTVPVQNLKYHTPPVQCIDTLPITVYGSECSKVNKADMQRVDAWDLCCLRMILNTRWCDFVRNEDDCHKTEKPPLCSTVRS